MPKAAKRKKTVKVKTSVKKSAKKSVRKSVKKSAKKSNRKAAKRSTRRGSAQTVKGVKRMMKNSTETHEQKTPQIPKSQVSVGEHVPHFELPATTQRQISLAGLRGKKIVLYFYPKDCTPGCTIEGHDFTRLHTEFRNAGAEVLGLSRDTVALHEKFKSQENFSFELLSDQEEMVCSIFGVIKMKNMYGKHVRGIERSTFVIDADGVLRKEWRGVKVEGHAQEVLDFVRQI